MSDLNEENPNIGHSESLNVKKDPFSSNHEVRHPGVDSNIIPTGTHNPLLYNFNYNEQNGDLGHYEESHTFPLFSGIADIPDSPYVSQVPNPAHHTNEGANRAPSDFPNYGDLTNFPSVDDMTGASAHDFSNKRRGSEENNMLAPQNAQGFGDYPAEFGDEQNGFIYQRNYFNPERRMSQEMERNAFYKPANYSTQPNAPGDPVRPLYYFDEYEANFGRPKKREKVAESSFAACEYTHRYCYICGINGRMIVCQKCNSVAHLKCAMLKRASEQGWICKPCMVQINKEALKYKEVLNSVNKGGQDLNTADVHLFKNEMILALDIPIELENLLIRLSNIDQTNNSFENN